MTYEENFWSTKPRLQSWPEVSQELTHIKMEKIREGPLKGPYGQILTGPLPKQVLVLSETCTNAYVDKCYRVGKGKRDC